MSDPRPDPESPADPPRLLALDCSTERMQVAVGGPAGIWRADEPGAAAASARLVPLILEGLAATGMDLASLDAIAFACGPGAFTGLRVAAAVAQGLAWGSGRPVLPVDSLLVVAEDARLHRAPGGEPVEAWVAMDARMDEIYAACYAWDGSRWHRRHLPALLSVAAFAEAVAGRPAALLAGSAVAAFGDRLPAGGFAHRDGMAQDRAGALWRAAVHGWRAGDARDDPGQALPTYLRDRVAATTAERLAARSAAGAAP